MRRQTVAAFCAAFAAAASAASTNLVVTSAPSIRHQAPSTNLPPVIVEASRLGKTALEMPLFVEVLNRAEIDACGAKDTTSLLERGSGLTVRRLGGDNPALAHISLRGYGENSFGRTLLVVDGERLNPVDMSTPNLARIPIDTIDHVEILHGPQTVLHGDNASAGVVNIVTEPADYAQKTSLDCKVGSWGTTGLGFHTRGGIADDGISYWGGGNFYHSDGFRDNAGYTLYDANGGVRQDWDNGSLLKVSAFYSNAQYDLPGGLSRSDWQHHRRNSNNPDDHARRNTYGANLSGTGVINDEHQLKLALTASTRSLYSHFEQGERPYRWYEHQESDAYSYSISPQYVCSERLFGHANEFTLGGDFRYDTISGREQYTGSYSALSRPDQQRFATGGFIHNEFFFTDELSFVAGSRLERSMARNELADQSAHNDNLCAFETALNWRPLDEAKIFAKWSRFYRNPFLDETPWYTNPSGSYVPKSILSPERGYSVDFGGDWNFLEQFSLGGSLFISETKNEVFYDAGTYANVNSPDAVLREGLESYLGWGIEKVADLKLRYAFIYAKFTEGAYDDKYVPLVPLHQIRLDGRLWLWDACFIRGGYQYCAKQVSCSDFNNAYDRLPDYGLFHAGIEYRPAYESLRGFTISLDIENLFDRNYANYSTYGSSYYPGSGRCFLCSLRYEF